jgi:hypothetical protein
VGPGTAATHGGEPGRAPTSEHGLAIPASGQRYGTDDRDTEAGGDQHQEDEEHHVTRVTDVTEQILWTLCRVSFRHRFVTHP